MWSWGTGTVLTTKKSVRACSIVFETTAKHESFHLRGTQKNTSATVRWSVLYEVACCIKLTYNSSRMFIIRSVFVFNNKRLTISSSLNTDVKRLPLSSISTSATIELGRYVTYYDTKTKDEYHYCRYY